MDFIHCPMCGERLGRRSVGDEGEVPYCGGCGRPWFAFSYPCVICIAVNEYNEIALIRQTYATTRFVCVAGFIACGETAENAAVREINEEIGLEVLGVKYIGSYYYEKNDNLMLGFAVKVKKADFRLSEAEVETAEWFTPTEAEELLSQGTIGICLLHDWIKQTDNGMEW